MTRGLLSLLCTHLDITPADQDGKALCTRCGATVTTTLTRAALADVFDSIVRDHGSYGRHSKRCVLSPDGNVCADDCTVGRSLL